MRRWPCRGQWPGQDLRTCGVGSLWVADGYHSVAARESGRLASRAGPLWAPGAVPLPEHGHRDIRQMTQAAALGPPVPLMYGTGHEPMIKTSSAQLRARLRPQCLGAVMQRPVSMLGVYQHRKVAASRLWEGLSGALSMGVTATHGRCGLLKGSTVGEHESCHHMLCAGVSPLCVACAPSWWGHIKAASGPLAVCVHCLGNPSFPWASLGAGTVRVSYAACVTSPAAASKAARVPAVTDDVDGVLFAGDRHNLGLWLWRGGWRWRGSVRCRGSGAGGVQLVCPPGREQPLSHGGSGCRPRSQADRSITMFTM